MNSDSSNDMEEIETQISYELSQPISVIKLENEQKTEVQSFSQKYYALIALAAGLCFSLNVFLFQVLIDKQHNEFHFTLFLPIFFGSLLSSTIYHLQQSIQLKRKYGVYWSIQKSTYFQSEENKGMRKQDFESMSIQQTQDKQDINELPRQDKKPLKFHYINFICMISRFCTSFLGFTVHLLVLYSSSKAHINYSLIINIYGMTPFLTAITFFCFFKERLNKFHVIGMVLIFICIFITSQSSKSLHTSNELGQISIIVPIFFAIVATCFFTVNSIISRFAITKGSITPAQLVADGHILQSIVLIALFLTNESPYPTKTLLQVAGISITNTLGGYLVSEACSYGKAGPAQALVEFQSLFLLILEITILGKIPSTLQVIAFGFGLSGGLLIAFDIFMKKQ